MDETASERLASVADLATRRRRTATADPVVRTPERHEDEDEDEATQAYWRRMQDLRSELAGLRGLDDAS